jgi:hypothetical protein
MSQQGDAHGSQEDDWWRQLYDEAAPGGRSAAPRSGGESVDAHFDSAVSAVSPPPPPRPETLRLRRPTAPAPPSSWPRPTRDTPPGPRVPEGERVDGVAADPAGPVPRRDDGPDAVVRDEPAVEAAGAPAAAPVGPVEPAVPVEPVEPEQAEPPFVRGELSVERTTEPATEGFEPWDAWNAAPTFGVPSAPVPPEAPEPAAPEPAAEDRGPGPSPWDPWSATPSFADAQQPEPASAEAAPQPAEEEELRPWDAWSAEPTYGREGTTPRRPAVPPPTRPWEAWVAPRSQPRPNPTPTAPTAPAPAEQWGPPTPPPPPAAPEDSRAGDEEVGAAAPPPPPPPTTASAPGPTPLAPADVPTEPAEPAAASELPAERRPGLESEAEEGAAEQPPVIAEPVPNPRREPTPDVYTESHPGEGVAEQPVPGPTREPAPGATALPAAEPASPPDPRVVHLAELAAGSARGDVRPPEPASEVQPREAESEPHVAPVTRSEAAPGNGPGAVRPPAPAPAPRGVFGPPPFTTGSSDDSAPRPGWGETRFAEGEVRWAPELPPGWEPAWEPRETVGAPEVVGGGPPTYGAEPTAWPEADPDALDGQVADTVLDGARYGRLTIRTAAIRGDSARYRGQPRRDALLTARFGSGDDALLLVAMASGARAADDAHRASQDAVRWIAGAVGRSRARLSDDLRAARRGSLKSGLHRLTDRCYGRLRARGEDLGLGEGTYTASLRCLLLPADPECRIRLYFGVGEGGLFRIRDGAWQDLDLDLEPDEGGTPFRFRATVAQPGDALLMCSAGLSEPLRGEPELAARLAGRWGAGRVPGLAAYLADAQTRVKGYADDRTAVTVWDA